MKANDFENDINLLKQKCDSLDSIQQSYIDLFDKVMIYNKEVMGMIDALRKDLEAADDRMQNIELKQDRLADYINELKEGTDQ